MGEGKFRRGEDIRRLPLVLKDEEAKEAFIEDDFQAGLDQLEQKNPAAKSKLFEKIEDVVTGLEKIHFTELDEIKRGLQPAKVDSLKRLYSITEKVLTNIGTLS